MVEEKTVMASSPINIPQGGAAPQTFGQKMVFMLPGLIIVLVLAVGIGYFIANSMNAETEKKLQDAKAALEGRCNTLGEDIKKVDSENKKTQKDLADLSAKAEEIEKNRQKMASTLADVSKNMENLVALDLSNFVKKSKEELTDLNKETTKTKDDVSKIDRRVVYIEDRIKKIDELDASVKDLKDVTGTLKKDHEALKLFANEIKKKADITEQDLAQLDERARLFQLRVLAARAREAAEAARQMDLKTLLNRLDDVEDKK